MLFFKVEAKIAGKAAEMSADEKSADKGAADRNNELDWETYFKRREINGKYNNVYYFVSRVNGDNLQGCMLVCNENGRGNTDVSFPWDELNLKVENQTVTEITSADFYEETETAGMNALSATSAIHNILLRMRRSLDFTGGGILSDEFFYSEELAEPESKEDYIDYADKNLWGDELSEEFGRIYSPFNSKKFIGHPVHYLLRSDNTKVRSEVAKKLVGALWQNGRLESRRVGTLNVSNISGRELRYLKWLYSCYTGGTICLQFRFSQSEDYAGSVEDTVELLCRLIREYKNKVLTIFCFPLSAEREKAAFFYNLSDLSVCELGDSLVGDERAAEYLKSLAQDTGVQPDSELTSQISAGKSYFSTELKKIFDNWYADMLKRTLYPVYSGVKRLGAADTVKTIEGSAYGKLMCMTGLGGVKNIIRQAVNYCKAAKIFSDKGMPSKRLAMNMVFAGSPGTAKTTVARLFAEIMKDNGVLSSGQLIEVGRSQLVGKYVGHTAPLIKRQFALARGGVLFIDEAYSLVDDRTGSFGDEAINAIVQEMENNREDTVVIFAGYTDRMKEFIERNPGLNSRISFFVNFDNYSADELMEITLSMSADYGVAFTAEALEKVKKVYLESCHAKDFGNGRFVRNMIEKAKLAQADRLMSMDYEDVSENDIITITAEDICVPAVAEKVKFSLGFGE